MINALPSAKDASVSADERAMFLAADFHLQLHQFIMTSLLNFLINLISHFAAGSVVFWRIHEATNAIELLFLDESQ